MFRTKISLATEPDTKNKHVFNKFWTKMLDENCHSHSVWKTDFVRALKSEKTDKKFTFSLAATWAVNMIAGSYCFPSYVSALASRAQSDVVRHGLLENAWDESGAYAHASRSHFWLAVRLGRLLGLSDCEIENLEPLPEAQKYTDVHYRHCVSGDFGFALGMICLIEEFTTPEFGMLFKVFLRSCGAGLGLDSAGFVLNGGAEYFTANISDDERHRDEMPRLVAAWLQTNGVDLNDYSALEEGLTSVNSGIKFSADLREDFFNGIYKFVNEGGKFRDLSHCPQQ